MCVKIGQPIQCGPSTAGGLIAQDSGDLRLSNISSGITHGPHECSVLLAGPGGLRVLAHPSNLDSRVQISIVSGADSSVV